MKGGATSKEIWLFLPSPLLLPPAGGRIKGKSPKLKRVSRLLFKKMEKTQFLKNFIHVYIELQKIARSLHNLDTAFCNGDLTKRQEKRMAKLEKEAEELAKLIGLTIYRQGDPRGCPLYLCEKETKVKELKEKGYFDYLTHGIPVIF